MKWLTTILILMTASVSLAEEIFRPVPPTGLPYTIIMEQIELNGGSLTPGDSIAVLDGELVVGTARFNGEYPVVVTAWKQDEEHALAGFQSGNKIGVKVKAEIYDSLFVFNPNVTVLEGDGTFGDGSLSALELTYETDFAPQMTVSENELSFGSVRIGESATRSFMINNNGDAPLAIYSVNIDHPRLTVGSVPDKIAPGETAQVTLTYAPNTQQPLNARAVISGNAPAKPDSTISLAGQGLPAIAPVLSLEPAVFNLGSVLVGETIETKARVYNRGNDTLNISSVSSSNSVLLNVQMDHREIPAGEYGDITIRFTPVETGSNSADLLFQSNSSQGSTSIYKVSALGFEGLLPLPEKTGLPYNLILEDIKVDNTQLSIGNEIAFYAGGTVVGHTVYAGEMPIIVTAWQADEDTGLQGFSPGDSIQARVATERYGEQMELEMALKMDYGDGDYGGGSFSVLSMFAQTGLAPELEMDRSPLFFQSNPIGYTDTLSRTIYNTGPNPLQIHRFEATGPYHVRDLTKGYVAKGDSSVISIVFETTYLGINEGSLLIHSNDPYNPVAEISLRGRGLIDVADERLSLARPGDGWLESESGVPTSEEIRLENRSGVTQQVTLSVSGEGISLSEYSYSLSPKSYKDIEVTLYQEETGAADILLTVLYEDGHEQEFEMRHLVYESHFPEVTPTGLPYTLVMSLVESDIVYDYGDQIAVFDEDQIVGIHRWKGSSNNIPITAWKSDENNNLPGFTPGNDIDFRVYKKVNEHDYRFEMEPAVKQFSGNGTFEEGSYQTVKLEVDESEYDDMPFFVNPGGQYKFKQNTFSTLEFGELDDLVVDPQGNEITHYFVSDNPGLTAEASSGMMLLSMEENFYGIVEILHTAETESVTITNTMTFTIADEPVYMVPDTLMLYVHAADTISLSSYEIDRDFTSVYQMTGDNIVDLEIRNDTLSYKVLAEGEALVNLHVEDEFGYELEKSITLISRYKKPWLTVDREEISFGEVMLETTDVVGLVFEHVITTERTYDIHFSDGQVFQSDRDSVNIGSMEADTVLFSFTPHEEQNYEDEVYITYNDAAADTLLQLTLKGSGTVPAYDTPDLLLPADSAIDQPPEVTFVWTAVDDAEIYEMEISESEAFESAVITETELSDTTYSTTEQLDYGKTYFWRVRATDFDANNGPWSEIRSFITVEEMVSIVVWPGDTNNDGVVDGADVLPIGLYYGEEFGEENNPGSSWEEHLREPWPADEGAPARVYTDANGNGVIDAADVLVIGLNYAHSWSDEDNETSDAETHILADEAGASAKGEHSKQVASDAEVIEEKLAVTIVEDSDEQDILRIAVKGGSDDVAIYGLSFKIHIQGHEGGITGHELLEESSDLGDDLLTFSMHPDDGEFIDLALSNTKGEGFRGVGTLVELIIEHNFNRHDDVVIHLEDVIAKASDGSNIVLKSDSLTHSVGQGVNTGMAMEEIPEAFELGTNYPNPFNPATQITYGLPLSAHVRLEVYDVMGRHVRTLVNQQQPAGYHTVFFDATQYASGVYIYRMQAGDFLQTRQMTLVK